MLMLVRLQSAPRRADASTRTLAGPHRILPGSMGGTGGDDARRDTGLGTGRAAGSPARRIRSRTGRSGSGHRATARRSAGTRGWATPARELHNSSEVPLPKSLSVTILLALRRRR